jgi:hypothetical protein
MLPAGGAHYRPSIDFDERSPDVTPLLDVSFEGFIERKLVG